MKINIFLLLLMVLRGVGNPLHPNHYARNLIIYMLILVCQSSNVEAIDRFQFRGWDCFKYLNCKMEVEAEAEAVEAALKSTRDSLSVCLYICLSPPPPSQWDIV